MRYNNRAPGDLRPISVEYDYQPNADASLLIRMGRTHVICAVSVEEKPPPFLKDSGQGWITGEYGMLPGATSTRYRRESVSGRSGRTYEIQRLIGRSLRMMVDMTELGERTLRVDCDVVNADGGTRTASITGGALALRRVLQNLVDRGEIEKMPELQPVAAISAGIVGGVPMLDLDYEEDSGAEVDGNFVMTASGEWIEVQMTAEGKPFPQEHFQAMSDLAAKGINKLFELWHEDD